MLDFILSKMNLLILVAAIFSITAFFLFHLSNVTVGFEAKQLMDQYSRSAAVIISSSNSCAAKNYSLPSYIQTMGSEKLYYVMKISSSSLDLPDGSRQNRLIFSISPRKDQDLVLAAESFVLDATPVFCGSSSGTVDCSVLPETGIILDPQKAIPINAFYLVKQISSGTSYLYIVPCNIESCKGLKNQASEYLKLHPSPAIGATSGGFQC